MNLNCQYFWPNLMCCLPPTLFSIMEKGETWDCFPGEVYAVLELNPGHHTSQENVAEAETWSLPIDP